MVLPYPPQSTPPIDGGYREQRPPRRRLLMPVVQESPPISPGIALQSQQAWLSSLEIPRDDDAEIKGGFITETETGINSLDPDYMTPNSALKSISFPSVLDSEEMMNYEGAAGDIWRRKESLYRLPAIVTPRRETNDQHTSHRNDGGNPPMNAVWRRYFFDEEKPMAFLRHFDVRIPAKERPEKLLGGHVHDSDPGISRYYYCDFLLLPEFRSPLEDGNPIINLDDVIIFLENIQPRTRLDVYPLYLLLKGILRKFTDKQAHFLSSRILQLEAKLREEEAERERLKRRQEEELRALLQRLENTSNALAEAEMKFAMEADKLKAAEAAEADARQQMEQNEKERLDLEKLVMKMDIEERTRLLNILAAQTSVISNMNPNAYVDSATLQAQEGLVRTSLLKLSQSEGQENQFRSVRNLVWRMYNIQRYNEIVQLINEYLEMNGADPAAHLTCKPFEDTEDKRAALLRAALSLCHGDGFSKQVLAAFGLTYASDESGTDKHSSPHRSTPERRRSSSREHMGRGTSRRRNSTSSARSQVSPAPSTGGRLDPPLKKSGSGRELEGKMSDEGRRSTSRESRMRRASGQSDDLIQGLAPQTSSVQTQTEASETEERHVQTEPIAILDKDSSQEEMAEVIEGFGLQNTLVRQMTMMNIEWRRPKKNDLLANWLGLDPSASASEIKNVTKCAGGSLASTLKHIANLFQAKMKHDSEHDAQKRPRQGFPEFTRDNFLQQMGLQSVAKSKLSDLIYFTQLEFEKGATKAHMRVRLLHRLLGLREHSEHDTIENSLEGVSFLLLLVQQLFPSWRYGAAFVKDFSVAKIELPLDTVEYALDLVFASKRYGGQIPENLLDVIRTSAAEAPKTKKKTVSQKSSRPKDMVSDDTRMVDVDFVLLTCHDEFLAMERHCIEELLRKYEEVDENHDGVLQYDEFSNLVNQIDSTMDPNDVAEMYFECVGDDDVIDRDELLTIISDKGMLFNLMNIQ